MVSTPPPWGIRAIYPRIPLPLQFRGWGSALRPFTLIAPGLGVLLAGIAAASYGVTVHVEPARLALGILALAGATAGGNLINQAEDHGEDAVNRPYRAIPRGLITPAAATTAGVLVWLVALAAAARLGTITSTLLLLIVAVSYTYSARPLRLKRIPWLGNLGVATARGILGWTAAWSIWAPITLPAVTMGLVLTLFLVGATTAKDFADAPGDRSQGVRTLVVTYGPRRAALLSLPFVLSPIATMPLLGAAGFLHASRIAVLLVALGCLGLGYAMLVQPLRPNATLEGSRPWFWMYLVLLLLMLAFAAPPSL